MKKLFLGLTLFSALLIAQVSSAQTQIDASELSTEFVQIEEQDGLIFSVSRQECVVIEGQKPVVYLFVQIENTTNEEITVDFNIALQYAEACSGCDYSSEHRSSIHLQRSELKEAGRSLRKTLNRFFVKHLSAFLEKEAFLSLLGEQKTLERIQHMLETNKPLRN